jgi:hypothetical protein
MGAPQTSAKAIFLQALELITVSERDEYLDTHCGSDSDLRREVEELLRHHGLVESFLDSPPTAVVESAKQLQAIAPPVPSLAFLSASSRADSLGRLGHYEILEIVGSGGMGIVLKAFDERLQRIVAIKAMNPALAASGTGRQRFVREAQAAAAVNHDNVVDIYAVEEAGPVPYLVMEYIAGISLEDKLRQQGCLALKEILRIGLQTADGLAAAHRQGLVHRDVKPANILLENGVERVKITDFGLARAADDVSVTQTGVIAGTPAYMSPEQARGEAVDHRSDLFSLGSVLYSLCTGQAPFRSSTSLGMLKQVCEEAPHPIRDLNADIPEWLCAVVAKLHAKLPAERFQSAAEVAETLGRYLAHVQQSAFPLPVGLEQAGGPQKPTPAKAGAASRPARRRWMIAAIGLITLGLSLGLTDASGITHVAATVIRIFTAEGTLVVEADPSVTVTIEGDGGLIITGAGPQEVMLRPGNYRVQASKDGKPVKRELITITRGGKQTLSVSMEATASSSPAGEVRRFAPYWGVVTCVAVSPDGQRALFGGEDTVVWLVDLSGKEKPRGLEGHTKQVLSVAFSPDGRRALSGSQDATVRLWDVESGKEIRQFEGHTEIVWEVAFSPDGRLAASGGGHLFEDGKYLPAKDTTVRLWDVETGTELRRLTGHKGHILSIAFSPDGKQALTGCSNDDPIIRLWDVASGNELRRLEGHSLGVYKLVFSADGRRALSAGADRIIRLWDVMTGKTIGRFLGHTRDVTGIAFSPDERYCVSSSWDNTVRLWDVESRKELHRFEGHTWSIRDVAFSPKGDTVLSGAEDGTVRLWQLPEETTTADPGKLKRSAFVLLAGNAVADREFATLAEAVQGASDGETIEIRGNGPFLTDTVEVKRPLTIRAGKGYRPVLKRNPLDEAKQALLTTDSSLVVEGLELQDLDNNPQRQRKRAFLESFGAPLLAANCRFVSAWATNMANGSPRVELRNCEVLCSWNLAATMAWVDPPSHGTLRVENCVSPNWGAFLMPSQKELTDINIEFVGNSFAQHLLLSCFSGGELWDDTLKPRPFRVHARNNVLRTRSIFRIEMNKYRTDLAAWPLSRVEKLANLMLDWHGEHNLYSPTSGYELWSHIEGTKRFGPTGKSRADWQKAWGAQDADATEGEIRFQGGNLQQRVLATPYAITPRDFRLADDSAGKGAGPDGKDLGADVDLVGPGAAYECWQQTFGYQQWLQGIQQVMTAEAARRDSNITAKALAELQGEWEHSDYGALAIRGDRYSFHPLEGPEIICTIKVVEVNDQATHVHLSHTGPDAKVRTAQNMLRVEGDTLHNCTTIGSIRPTEFATKPGFLYTQWKRIPKQVTDAEAAKSEPDAAAREIAKWQGEWTHPSYGKLVIHGNRWSSCPKNELEILSTIKIVEVTDEMTHILLLNQAIDGKVRTVQAILRVDGDTLHNCGTIGSVPPTEFENKPGFIYAQWKRVPYPPP